MNPYAQHELAQTGVSGTSSIQASYDFGEAVVQSAGGGNYTCSMAFRHPALSCEKDLKLLIRAADPATRMGAA